MKRFKYILLLLCCAALFFAVACQDGKTQTYSIVFESRGGTQIDPISGKAGIALGELPQPDRQHYDFIGWYDESLTERFSRSEMPAENVTLYALWNPITGFIISFESNGGTLVKSIKGEAGSPVAAPGEPTKAGSDFDGWFSDPELTKPYTFTIMPNENTVLYAKWTRDNSKAEVGFYGNGELMKTVFLTGGSKIGDGDLPEIFQDGSDEYENNGWRDGQGNSLDLGELTVDNDLSLYTDYHSKGLLVTDNKVTEYTGAGAHVVLPSGITEIAEFAFADNSDIRTVALPQSLVKIGRSAFLNCANLLSVEPTNGITGIADYAFYNCARLKSIDLRSVNVIGEGVFGNCTELAEALLSTNVSSIGAYAFANCRALGAVQFGSALISIKDYAFLNCQSMNSFQIPRNLSELGKGALQGCSGIKAVSVDRLNAYFDTDAGNNVYNDGMTTMYFYQQSGKTETVFQIPDTVTKVELSAFLDNMNLEHIIIPASLRDARGILTGFRKLNEITFSNLENITNIAYLYGAASPSDNGKTGMIVPASLTTVNFTALTAIPDLAFYGCTGIRSINGLDNVVSIGKSAFAYTTLYSEISVGGALAHIGDGAYEGCVIGSIVIDPQNIHFVTDGGVLYNTTEKTLIKVLPHVEAVDFGQEMFEDISIISAFAFEGCGNIETLNIPNTVTSIGSGAFAFCSGLRSVTMPVDSILDASTTFDSFFGGVIPELDYLEVTGSPAEIPDNAFMFCNIRKIVLPTSVKTIGKQAFSDNYALTEIEGLDNVEEIKEGAFYYCTALKTIDLGTALKTMEKIAFASSGLESISFPVSLVTIGAQAFYRCASLTDITFIDPENSNLKRIGNEAFLNASLVCDVLFPASLTEIGVFSFGMSGIKSISFAGTPTEDLTVEGWAFVACASLRTVAFQNNLIMLSDYAFYNCRQLYSIEFGNRLAYVGDFVFTYSESLINVTLPSSLTYVGQDIFRGGGWRAAQADGILYNGNAAVGFKGEFGDNVIDLVFESNPHGTQITVISKYVLLSRREGEDVAGYYEFFIRNLHIQDGYKYICEAAFVVYTTYASYIENAYIASSVEMIGDGAFAYSRLLKKVEIGSEAQGSALNYLGDYAFGDCVALTTFILHKNVESAVDLPRLVMDDDNGLPTVFARLEAVQSVPVTVYVPDLSFSVYQNTWKSGILPYFPMKMISEI